MIHYKDQSEQPLEGAPTKSINIPPPENLFFYKAQMQPKMSCIQMIDRLEIYIASR